MSNPFQKAERSQVYLKLGVTGPTGSGKTFSALRLAIGLLWGSDKRIAFLDTENNSASLYAPANGESADGVKTFDFDVLPIAPPFEADSFLSGITSAVEAGYGACIIDSASHFWKGILDFKDALDRRGGNSYTNWKDADKKFDPVIHAVLQSRIHMIFCMRSKMDYVLEDNGKGKQAPKKVGLAPIMRDGIDYEFSTVFDVAMDHSAVASKDRSGLFPVDKVFRITEDTGREIRDWLKTAKAPEDTAQQEKPKDEPAKPKLSEEDEHKKRVLGRYKAAQSAKPSDMHEDEWLKLYCATASDLLDLIEPRNALHEFVIQELKDLTLKHDEIVSKALESLPKKETATPPDTETEKRKILSALSKYVSDYTATGDDKIAVAAKFTRLACGALGLESEVPLNMLNLEQLKNLWKDRKGILKMASEVPAK